MSNNYDDDFLHQINENVDLFEYVSQTIDLKKKGNDYFGHCPLHVDNTPSFSITPSKNSYYCFSCGRSGKFLGYLMDYEGLTFDEAVEKGSKIASIDMSKMCKSSTVKFLKKLRTLNQRKKTPYIHQTIDNSILDKYDKEYPQQWLNEGITKESMDRFGILVDKWNNRIVYPVYDLAGRLINIKGRTLYENYKDLGIAKYMNYFTVGVMDYFQGLNFTIQDVKNKNEIIVFESLKSVMKAYGWGYKNCVSAEKHTLTDEQITLLIKLKVDIVLAWDSDIDYRKQDVKSNVDKLKRVTNIYIIEDRRGLLGGAEAKNAPIDLTKEIWEELYFSKRKVV